jgi:GNAT superfamily N-acetyltransferase
VDVLVRFNQAMALETEQKTLDATRLREGIGGVFTQPRRGFYLVAEHAEQVLGALLITYEWSDWRCGDWWWIQSVYVVPEARSAGIFSQLYREAERRARESRGVVGLRLYVERDNRRAQGVYSHLGMTETAYRMYEKPFVAD